MHIKGHGKMRIFSDVYWFQMQFLTTLNLVIFSNLPIKNNYYYFDERRILERGLPVAAPSPS